MQRRWLSLGLCVAAACANSSGGGERTGGGSDESADPVCSSCGACEESVEIDAADHLTGDLQYDDPPPAGGDHAPCWAPWGVHDDAVPDENWVHNLEHGGIVFLTSCGAECEAERAALATWVEGRKFALLTSYAGLPDGARFAVVAWGHRLVSECFDLQAFEAFYDAHVDRAPESVATDPPADCGDAH